MGEPQDPLLKRLIYLRKFLLAEYKDIRPDIPREQAIIYPIKASGSFADQTIRSLMMLQTSRLQFQMPILARSVLETACLVRWASLAQDGWIALRSHECQRLLRDTNGMRQMVSDLPPLGSHVAEHAEVVQSGRIAGPPWKIKSLMSEVQRLEIKAGQQYLDSQYAEFRYVVVYGMLSRFAHGRISQFVAEPEDAAGTAVNATTESVILILMAANAAAGRDYNVLMNKLPTLYPPDIEQKIRQAARQRPQYKV